MAEVAGALAAGEAVVAGEAEEAAQEASKLTVAEDEEEAEVVAEEVVEGVEAEVALVVKAGHRRCSSFPTGLRVSSCPKGKLIPLSLETWFPANLSTGRNA